MAFAAGLKSFLPSVMRLICSAGLLLLVGASTLAQDVKSVSKRVPQPVIEPARGGQCVEDPAFMRRNHMEMLKHRRDDTLRGGVRTASKTSLKACIECHASKTTDSVNASSSNFCQSCHTFVAVKIDCFECHASKPAPTAFHPLVSHGSSGDPTTIMKMRQLVGQQQVKP